MELLIPEIFDIVLGFLDTPDISRLLRCSKILARRLEPILFASPSNRDQAMRWACMTGNLSTAQRAMAYGADPSIVQRRQRTCKIDGSERPARVLTLYLAAKHSRPVIFRELIQRFGAKMNPAPEFTEILLQVKKIMHWLCMRPNLHGCLQTVLDQGMDREIRTMHCNAAVWPLILAVRGGAPQHILQQLSDRDASNLDQRVCRYQHRNDKTPLSTAILDIRTDRIEMVNFLVDTGASIHGPRHGGFPPSASPTHIPVFAAARAMALAPVTDSSGRDLLKACLERGANINQHACQLGDARRYWGNEDWLSLSASISICYYTTPLLAYLESVPTWTSTEMQARLDDVDFLISKGARIGSPSEVPPKASAPGYDCLPSPSPLELLLGKWGLHRIAEPSFADMLISLAGMGGAALREEQLLLNYQWHNGKNSSDEQMRQILDAWRRIITAVIKNISESNPKPSQKLDLLLGELIIGKARAIWYRTITPDLDEMYLLTLNTLIESGADINARDPKLGSTPLYAVCDYFGTISMDYGVSDSYGLTADWVIRRHLGLVKFLLSHGADPAKVCSEETPTEALFQMRDIASPSGEKFILQVEKILRKEEASKGTI